MAGLIQTELAKAIMAERYEFKIHKSKDAQFFFTLHNTRGNVEPVAVSEMYTSKQSCEHTIHQIQKLAATSSVRDLTL
jgi:uncharacterized protein YegP (UPF0339 family)